MSARDATHFAVLPGHVDPEIERCVAQNERFAVVAKTAPQAARIAEREDPGLTPDGRARSRGARPPGGAEEPRLPAMPVKPTTGRFLFSLVAPQADCEVLEVGAGRGHSTIWFAAGVRSLGGRVVSLERDPDVAADWRRNIAAAGLEEWTELIERDALEMLSAWTTSSTSSFSMRRKTSTSATSISLAA